LNDFFDKLLIFRPLQHASKTWFHYLILLAGILCIGWSAIFVKLAGVSGLASGFYRMFIAALSISPVFFIKNKSLPNWHDAKIAILCGIFFGCDIALWNTSIMLSKASVSTLLANMAPVWVGLGAIFILREKPKLLFWVGTLTALLGVSIVIGVNTIFNNQPTLGNLLAIAASMFYGAYLLTVRKGRGRLDTISFSTISMAVSAALILVFCLISGVQLWGFSSNTWFALAGVGLISQLGGWLAINFALGHIKPTIASVSLLSQSIFTALFAIPVLGETLSWNEIAGAFVVLTGIYLVSRKNSA
jgi:drug/metabolite transporter (DMT)-like permease